MLEKYKLLDFNSEIIHITYPTSSMKTTILYHKPKYDIFWPLRLSILILRYSLWSCFISTLTIPKDRQIDRHARALADRAVNQILLHKVDITVKLY